MRTRSMSAALTTALVAASVLLAVEAGAASPKAPAVKIHVSNIKEHSAKLTAGINTEGSDTTYKIWIQPGCSGGTCEQAGPTVAKSGQIAGGRGTKIVSVTVNSLPAAVSNNEAWAEATNGVGTTKSSPHRFKTKRKPEKE